MRNAFLKIIFWSCLYDIKSNCFLWGKRKFWQSFPHLNLSKILTARQCLKILRYAWDKWNEYLAKTSWFVILRMQAIKVKGVMLLWTNIWFSTVYKSCWSKFGKIKTWRGGVLLRASDTKREQCPFSDRLWPMRWWTSYLQKVFICFALKL